MPRQLKFPCYQEYCKKAEEMFRSNPNLPEISNPDILAVRFDSCTITIIADNIKKCDIDRLAYHYLTKLCECHGVTELGGYTQAQLIVILNLQIVLERVRRFHPNPNDKRHPTVLRHIESEIKQKADEYHQATIALSTAVTEDAKAFAEEQLQIVIGVIRHTFNKSHVMLDELEKEKNLQIEARKKPRERVLAAMAKKMADAAEAIKALEEIRKAQEEARRALDEAADEAATEAEAECDLQAEKKERKEMEQKTLLSAGAKQPPAKSTLFAKEEEERTESPPQLMSSVVFNKLCHL